MEYREAYKEDCKNFLNEWQWQWFLSLNLKWKNYTGTLKRFLSDLQSQESIQVAYQGIANLKGEPYHLHLLMLGQNKQGKTLSEVDRNKWTRVWGRKAHKSDRIDELPTADDQRRAISYMIDRNTPRGGHEFVDYNKKLLARGRAAPSSSFPLTSERH